MHTKKLADSLQKVKTPKWIRRLAYLLVIFSFIGILMLGFVPWQQTVVGTGQVTSFSPNDRPQQVESPIKGQIIKWHVQEGMKVKEGDLIVELKDLEKEFLPPEIIQLTEASKTSLTVNRQSYIDKANSIESSIQSLRLNLKESVRAAQQNVNIAKGDLETAKINLKRVNTLSGRGLTSTREKELTIQAEIKAAGDLNRAEIELDRISSKTLADIAKLESEKSSALADASKSTDELAKIDIKLSTAKVRQDISKVRAPRDGIVVKLFKRGPGETFKENEKVAVITPLTMDQAAEVFVSDVDAPLIHEGQHVRLQFSGWPAVQFAGLSNAVRLGTFGGIVAVVDNVDSGNGKYRVLIVPDKDTWPAPRYLRPGTRVAGWIILNTVSFGAELWRRFNRFPIPFDKIDKPVDENKEGYFFDSKGEDTDGKNKNVVFERKVK
jgi:multidrug efflux pump subunit AcrA (membrane-fusion protein)